MDWAATNNSKVVNWSDRATPTSPSQAGGNGVVLEYLIQLAKTLKIEPWFTLLAQSTDDCVRHAVMVRDR